MAMSKPLKVVKPKFRFDHFQKLCDNPTTASLTKHNMLSVRMVRIASCILAMHLQKHEYVISKWERYCAFTRRASRRVSGKIIL